MFALAVGALAALLASSAWANPPEVDFMLECQGCHRGAGDGWPGMVPRLAGQVSKFLHSEDGRAYLVRVPGVAQSALSDERLAAVLTWTVRHFDPEHLPERFAPYTAEEVGRWRRDIVRNVTAVRHRILAESGFEAPDAYSVPGALYARPETLP